MRMTRRQAAFWIAVALMEVLAVVRLPPGATIRVVDGVAYLGTFDAPPPRPCATKAAVSLEDLESQDTTCHLGGAVVVVPGGVLRGPGGGPVPPDELVRVPEPGDGEARSGDDGAGGIGVVHFADGLGVVVFTHQHAWGLPEAVDRAREWKLLDLPELDPAWDPGP